MLVFSLEKKNKCKNLKNKLKKIPNGIRSPLLLAPRILLPPLALRHIATGF